MTPLNQHTSCTSARALDAFHARDDSDPAVSSVSQPLVLPAWLYTYQPNKLACGGARHEGKRRAVPPAALRLRWVRIFSITTGSSMQAMTCTDALMSREAGCRERLTCTDALMSREAGKDCSYNPFAFPPSLAVRCRERLTCTDALMSREAGKDCSYNPFAFPPSMAVRCRERLTSRGRRSSCRSRCRC